MEAGGEEANHFSSLQETHQNEANPVGIITDTQEKPPPLKRRSTKKKQKSSMFGQFTSSLSRTVTSGFQSVASAGTVVFDKVKDVVNLNEKKQDGENVM